MAQGRIPAVFMRGGTSKAVIFRAADLPDGLAARDAIFLDVIGSPDLNGRQLDGMGGGVSSLSKVCIVGPATRPDADVDYTFAQVSVTDAVVDYSANCGNMSSAIGPFAIDEGLVRPTAQAEASVRIHNTNTGKIIRATFPVTDGEAEVEGGFVLDGVSGTGAAIRLDFERPGGSKTGRLLPAGSSMTRLDIEGLGTIEASLIDAATPCAFVLASDLGKTGTELPSELECDPVTLQRLEAIRRAAAVAMGTAPDLHAAAAVLSVPGVAMVSAPCVADAFGTGVRSVRHRLGGQDDLRRAAAPRRSSDGRIVPCRGKPDPGKHPVARQAARFGADPHRPSLGDHRRRCCRCFRAGRTGSRVGGGLPDGPAPVRGLRAREGEGLAEGRR